MTLAPALALARPQPRSSGARLRYPLSCPGVPSALLDPSASWADAAEFAATQADLATLFAKNFAKYAARAKPEVIACGPAQPPYPVQ